MSPQHAFATAKDCGAGLGSPASKEKLKPIGVTDNEGGVVVTVSDTGMVWELGDAPGAETVIEAL